MEAAGTRFEGDAGEKAGLSLEQVVEQEMETGHVSAQTCMGRHIGCSDP